jgi:hypothetical protein
MFTQLIQIVIVKIVPARLRQLGRKSTGTPSQPPQFTVGVLLCTWYLYNVIMILTAFVCLVTVPDHCRAQQSLDLTKRLYRVVTAFKTKSRNW